MYNDTAKNGKRQIVNTDGPRPCFEISVAKNSQFIAISVAMGTRDKNKNQASIILFKYCLFVDPPFSNNCFMHIFF